MIDFKLVAEHGGWKSTAVPDDLEILVRIESESTRIRASLDELLRAFAHVYHQSDGTVPVYTSTLHFQFTGDVCQVSLPSVETEVRTSELTSSFEDVLTSIFKSKDGTDPEIREKQLEYVSTKLVEKDLEYDIRGLYEELAG